jgi:hypothetical protein
MEWSTDTKYIDRETTVKFREAGKNKKEEERGSLRFLCCEQLPAKSKASRLVVDTVERNAIISV